MLTLDELSNSGDDQDICRQSYRPGMMNCCKCEEWFHPECTKFSIDDASKFKEQSNQPKFEFRQQKSCIQERIRKC